VATSNLISERALGRELAEWFATSASAFTRLRFNRNFSPSSRQHPVKHGIGTVGEFYQPRSPHCPGWRNSWCAGPPLQGILEPSRRNSERFSKDGWFRRRHGHIDADGISPSPTARKNSSDFSGKFIAPQRSKNSLSYPWSEPRHHRRQASSLPLSSSRPTSRSSKLGPENNIRVSCARRGS